MLLHVRECPHHKGEPPCYVRGLIVLTDEGPKFAYHNGLTIGEAMMECGQDGCKEAVEVRRVDRELCDYAWDTLPVDVPDNGFYSAIDEDMRQLVQLLRNSGINTTCCCSHSAPPYIQFECYDVGESMVVHNLLACSGFVDYEIETNLQFPKDGPYLYRGEVRFNRWYRGIE